MDYLLETMIGYRNVIKYPLSCVFPSCPVPFHFMILLVWQLSKALETVFGEDEDFQARGFFIENPEADGIER